jgi:hypothetical protein
MMSAISGYTSLWRAEMYNFVRKKSDRAPVPSNPAVDCLIKSFLRYTDSHDIWPLIRPVLSLLSLIGRTEWSLVGAFVRTMIDRKPASIDATTEIVAKRCGLGRYEEVVGE